MGKERPSLELLCLRGLMLGLPVSILTAKVKGQFRYRDLYLYLCNSPAHLASDCPQKGSYRGFTPKPVPRPQVNFCRTKQKEDPSKQSKKVKKERIVLREIHLRTTGRHLSMGSHSVICHPTEVANLPPNLPPNRAGWYSIYRPRKDERLSWPSWLVTYRNGLPVHRRSPIRVLIGSDVAQLR